MKILWHRVFAATLGLVVLVVVVMNMSELGLALRSTTRIGPDGSPSERTLGLLSLGIITVAMVAIVRLLTHRKDK
jgi:hypothetical protein